MPIALKTTMLLDRVEPVHDVRLVRPSQEPRWQALVRRRRASWSIALFEYLLQVPANRLGYTRFSLAQLKIMQEVITLARVRAVRAPVHAGSRSSSTICGRASACSERCISCFAETVGMKRPVGARQARPFYREVYGSSDVSRRGKVATYGQLAALLGRPRAVRAVGSALRRLNGPMLRGRSVASRTRTREVA